jgi:D-aminopeptidase
VAEGAPSVTISGSPARELGIQIGRLPPGRNDAITDVVGVRVGHTTLIRGNGPLVVGQGPVRTGVTVILPHDGEIGEEPLFAGCHRLNGNGELTGLEWVRESGMLMSPIAITNTHSVGTVRDALIGYQVKRRPNGPIFWSLPVVGETWDGTLNDINGFHVKAEHVERALSVASDGPVEQGNVGGGTGMICHDFKGGIGTASRVLNNDDGGYTVGVLVQANHGRRHRLAINGMPIGARIGPEVVPEPGLPEPDWSEPGTGSIIIVVATDAPLLPHQCDRLAQRAGLGVARTGGVGEHSSGDLFLCFSVANRGMPPSKRVAGVRLTSTVEVLSDLRITPLFDAVVEATEEAIVNALLAAETMVGRDGVTAHALEADRLVAVMSSDGAVPPG